MTPAIFDGKIANQFRAVLLKTSSWAMANCFLIEKRLGRRRSHWYIDGRITENASLRTPFA